jgi:hypothetical protein
LVGVSGADILLDRPPGGWSDLVTNESLDQRFAVSDARVDRKLDSFEHRIDRRIDRRFSDVDSRFTDLERRMELHFADVDHRFDRFEHQLLASVDRRLRAQAWMTISTIAAVGGVLVAAIRH